MIDADLYPTTDLIERAITEACDTIAREYDLVLDAPTARTPGPKTALTTAGDHDPTSADMDRATRLVDLRARTALALNGWCRVVMEDRPITSAKALPLGSDVPGMCAFLTRHAQWIAGRDEGPACAADLTDCATEVKTTASPHRREWLTLGPCPFVTVDTDGHGHTCRGRVRVHVSTASEEAACSHCGQAGPVEWWEVVLGISVLGEIVGTGGLARALRERLHVTVTERTLRTWARDGRITPHTPFGPIEDPARPRRAWWFDLRRVLDEVALMDRACTLCGRLFSGRGPTCLRCLATMHVGPIFTPERPAYTVRTVPADPTPPRPLERALSERDRCDATDLPVAWCGCKRHRAGA